MVVFDEAHNLEAVASDHLGVNLTSGQIEYVLNKLYNDRTNKGLLVHHQLADAQREVEACRVRADELFGRDRRRSGSLRQADGAHRAARHGRQSAQPRAGQTGPPVLKACGAEVPDDERLDFTSAAERLQALAGEIEDWRQPALDDAVYWVESAQPARPARG